MKNMHKRVSLFLVGSYIHVARDRDSSVWQPAISSSRYINNIIIATVNFCPRENFSAIVLTIIIVINHNM